jgi:hypothetical protein
MFSLNFILGGVFGSIGTYIYKDEKAKQWALASGKQLIEKTQSFVASCQKKTATENVAVESSTVNVAEPAGAVLEK